jgi:hypothetical protein
MPIERREPYDGAPPRAVTPPSLLASQYGEKSPQLDEVAAIAAGAARHAAAANNAVTIKTRNDRIVGLAFFTTGGEEKRR